MAFLFSSPRAICDFSLVVTKIAGLDNARHMAYIDALANPDANGVAQKAADAMAGSFDCVRD